MANIRDILGVAPEMNRAELKKVSRETGKSEAGRESSKDKLEISPEGRELLEMKTEAASAENLIEVNKADTISEKRLEVIRARIEDNFYNNPDIIEKIMDELMELPNLIEDLGK